MTGTEGSIPPATAFDESQIEIVNVITNAKAGRQTTMDPSGALFDPDHSKLYQLWDALITMIARKYITTPIVKTVHSGPSGEVPDFPDLFVALDWVSNYTITYTGSVTFLIGPGKWVYTHTVEVNHPNSNRIFIQGAALKGAAPAPGNIDVTGYTPAQRTADGNRQIIAFRAAFATELSFTGGVTGLRIFTFGVALRYLLITGSQSIDNTDPYGGRGIELYNDVWHDIVAIWGFGDRGLNIWNCNFRGIGAGPFYSCFNGSHGVHCYGGGYIANFNSDSVFNSNGNSGYRSFGSWTWFARATCAGNGGVGGSQPGAEGIEGGFIDVTTWIDCHLNAGSGYGGYGTTSLMAMRSYFRQNAIYGVQLTGNSFGELQQSVFGGNGTGYAIVAQLGSSVDAVGSALGGENVSPPANTYAPGNAWIQF